MRTAQSVLGHEGLELLERVVERDGDEAHLRRIRGLVHRFHQRHLGPAVRAPGSPELQHDRLAGEVAQPYRPAFQIVQDELRRYRAHLQQIHRILVVRVRGRLDLLEGCFPEFDAAVQIIHLVAGLREHFRRCGAAPAGTAVDGQRPLHRA